MATTRREVTNRALRAARAEFLARPEPIGEPAYELRADGSLAQKIAPKPRHSALREELLFRFRAARARRLAQAYPELRIAWRDENVPPSVPDIVVYRWARRPIGPDGQLADEANDAPDLAIEIVSPGQAPAQVGARCAEYVERGVVRRSGGLSRPGGAVAQEADRARFAAAVARAVDERCRDQTILALGVGDAAAPRALADKAVDIDGVLLGGVAAGAHLNPLSDAHSRQPRGSGPTRQRRAEVEI